MIMAVAELISSQRSKVMSKTPAIIISFLKISMFLPVFVLAALALGKLSFLEQKANANNLQLKQLPENDNCARIVISKADYMRKPNSDKPQLIRLPEIARQTIYRYFGKENLLATQNKSTQAAKPASGLIGSRFDKNAMPTSIMTFADALSVDPKFKQAAGVFVTLSKNGKTRACWGSVYPREASIVRETVLSTLGALTKEYRFKPLSFSEVKDIKIQVTVVRELKAVSSSSQINPFRDGVLVRAGGRGGVILPGEAVDAHYELVLAKLKAGIRPDEACQIYKIRTEIYD